MLFLQAEIVSTMLRWLPEDILVHNEDLEGMSLTFVDLKFHFFFLLCVCVCFTLSLMLEKKCEKFMNMNTPVHFSPLQPHISAC